MADLPIFTTNADVDKHAVPVSITLTANEWIFLSSCLTVMSEKPGLDPAYFKAIKDATAYMDQNVAEGILRDKIARGDYGPGIVEEVERRGNVRGEH